MKLRTKEIEGKFYIQRYTFQDEWKSIRYYETQEEADKFKEWLEKDVD